jgi:glyoxylase-like metal-dependent hydrolase (beta-lactamase superfamily II)
MHRIHQMNFGVSDSNMDDCLPRAICNCLLIEDREKIILVDTGLGILEIETLIRLSEKIHGLYTVPINSNLPAARQLPLLGLNCNDVSDVILTHLDLDHAGGLRDFPNAEVHLSAEEFSDRHNLRYLHTQYEHFPKWNPHPASTEIWFGLEARNVPIANELEIKLIPLPGHTVGHCGVAVREKNANNRWVLHVGDAYYNREELYSPVGMLGSISRISSEDNWQRLASMANIRRLLHRYPDEIDVVSSHDPSETIENSWHGEVNRITLNPLLRKPNR